MTKKSSDIEEKGYEKYTNSERPRKVQINIVHTNNKNFQQAYSFYVILEAVSICRT